MRSSKYNAALLAPIVQSSKSLADVLRRLGLPTTGGNYRMISARVRQAGLDVSHFYRDTLANRCAAVPPDSLALLVADSTSLAQVLAKLELPTEGRSHHEMAHRIRQLGIPTTHFRGRGWSRGETRMSHPSVRQMSKHRAWPDAQVFVENSALISGKGITRRLLAMGWPYRCVWCDISEWLGEALVLHLDHINGIHNDNRLENLRFLCPNCHSQTETYSNRRRDRRL